MAEDLSTLMLRVKADLDSVNIATQQINKKVNSSFKSLESDIKKSTDNITRTVSTSANKITSIFKKIGAAAATYLSVRALVNFGKESIKLASDLEEVQNVVDVVFGSLSDNVNKFAKDAITAYGLNELAAKRYVGTLGAMFKSMGIGTEQALEMSKTMTALAGDIASFYNLDTEEAFNKIRSGISGEIEPLKQLGINLSVANLEAYALSKGIKTAYKSMTESQKALLRYNYLLDVTKDAQGDFVRNSDSWANKVRVLSLRWEGLKVTLGKAFIAVLNPVLDGIGKLIGYLDIAATKFTQFIQKITGTSNSINSNVSKSTENVVNSVVGVSQDAIGSVEDVTNATNNAIKKTKRTLAGFDELVSLSSGDSGNINIGSSLDTGTLGNSLIDIDNNIEGTSTKLDEINNKFSRIKETIIDIGKKVRENFESKIDTSYIESIKNSFNDLKTSAADIFSNIRGNLSGYIEDISISLGGISGNFSNVGLSIGSSILGGISDYFKDNKERISSIVNDIINNFRESFKNIESISDTIGDLLSDFFGSESIRNTFNNLTGILVESYLGINKIVSSIFKDLTENVDIYLKDIDDNLGTFLGNIGNTLSEITGLAKDIVSDTFETIYDKYEQYVKPALGEIREGITNITNTILSSWNEHIQPVIDRVVSRLREIYEKSLKPLIDKLAEFGGKAIEVASIIYNRFIAPVVSWFIKILVPKVAFVFDLVSSIVSGAVESIGNIISGLLDTLNGILDFLKGVFTGDWELAWEGLKNVVKGIWDTLGSILKAPINILIDAINSVIRGINKISINIPKNPITGKEIKLGFNIPEIPKLADGGIVTQATQFIAGEAGAEVVFPLQNSKFIRDFAEILGNYIRDSINNSSNVINIGTLIQDDRGYEWLADIIAQVMARNRYLGNEGI